MILEVIRILIVNITINIQKSSLVHCKSPQGSFSRGKDRNKAHISVLSCDLPTGEVTLEHFSDNIARTGPYYRFLGLGDASLEDITGQRAQQDGSEELATMPPNNWRQ